MYRGIAWKGAVALAALGMTAPLAAAAASASPSPNVSFSASNDGASAGWTAGKGSPIDLTLGTDSASTYAAIELHHVGGTVGQIQEPTFVTSNYNSGSPRYYITLSDGNSLWGYPPQEGENGSNFGWAVDNGYPFVTWSAIQSGPESGATVTGAWVIADGDQSPGTVDQIDNLSFNGLQFNG